MKKVLFMALAMLVAFASCKKEEKTPDPITPTPTPTPTISVTGYSSSQLFAVNHEIEILVKVECSTTIESVKLVYTLNSSADSTIVDMVEGTYSTWIGGNYNYKGIIPAQSLPTTVTWYVIATASDGTMSKSLKDILEVYDIVLNEISGLDGSKYFELYNPSTSEIDISGYQIKKDEKTVWTATKSIKLGSSDFLLLYSEDVVAEGQPHYGYDPDLVFASGISPKKTVKVELFNKNGNSINTFVRGVEPWGTKISEVNKAFARIPNNYGDWKLAEETPNDYNPDAGDEIPQE